MTLCYEFTGFLYGIYVYGAFRTLCTQSIYIALRVRTHGVSYPLLYNFYYKVVKMFIIIYLEINPWWYSAENIIIQSIGKEI